MVPYALMYCIRAVKSARVMSSVAERVHDVVERHYQETAAVLELVDVGLVRRERRGLGDVARLEQVGVGHDRVLTRLAARDAPGRVDALGLP
jgi:hypothetical protein